MAKTDPILPTEWKPSQLMLLSVTTWTVPRNRPALLAFTKNTVKQELEKKEIKSAYATLHMLRCLGLCTQGQL